MKPRIVVVVVITLLVIGLFVVALSRHNAAAKLEGALATAHAELAVAKAKIQQLEVKGRMNASPADKASSSRGKSEVALRKSELPSATAQIQKQKRESTIDQAATQSPELQDLYVKQQTVRYPQKYGLLYASLGLSPDQIAAFERIMSENWQAVIDITASALGQGIAKDDSAAKTLGRNAHEQRNEQLRTLLGDSGFKEFVSYERNPGGKNLADTLAQNLYYTDSPINRDTATALTRLVAENAVRNGGSLNWSDLISDARRFMTPTQVRALEIQGEIISTGARVHEALKKAGVDMNNPNP